MSDHGAPKPAPVDYDELFPGRFLKAGLLKGREVTLTISHIDVERLPQEDGTERDRGVISFAKTEKQLVLNSTNGQCFRAMFGRKLADWVGKRVTLAPERDRLGRELVDCIRVAGSPDLAADMTIEIVLPRKKPKPRLLRRTGKARSSQPRAVVEMPNSSNPMEPAQAYEPGGEG